MNAPALVLASQSPRRRALLAQLGLHAEVRPAHVDETRHAGEGPRAYVERLARTKALAVPGPLVLGADTTVAVDDHILEKPADADDALRMLRLLQGRSHEVYTAVALAAGGALFAATDVSRVTFAPCDDATLRAYVATGEPMDKAGAYAIQGHGSALVTRIEGDFFGVMGLPLRLVTELLARAGQPYAFPAAGA
ncbi:MAG: Maf family protein [Gemmatimonadales bacterium]|nr:Maf family protein [Gemmatimonadales bacterium]